MSASQGFLKGVAIAFLVPLAAGAGPAPADAEIRDALAAILKRPEFKTGTPFNVVRWIFEKIEKFFRWLGSLSETAPVLYWVLLVGCFVTLGLLIWHITWTLRKVFYAKKESEYENSLTKERTRRWAAYREEAMARAEEGDYTEAIRDLFLSLVYLFDERGKVSFQRAYTNREYLRLFDDRPDVRADLQVFVDTLDEHWYGQHPTNRERFENCLALYQSLN